MEELSTRNLWRFNSADCLTDLSTSLSFRSYSHLNSDVKRLIPEIQNKYDLIIGVPRSGIVPATMISLYLNLPFASLSEFLVSDVLRQDFTNRKSIAHTKLEQGESLRILVVDDSFNTGKSMANVKSRLSARNDLARHSFNYIAIYAAGGDKYKLDHPSSVCETPRVFEWNIFHHPMIENSLVDLDGILCPDGPPENSEDGGTYADYIASAKTKIRPSYAIGAIVTSRLEKYRNITEVWLKTRGIKYRQLVMLDLPNAEERRRLKVHARYKADVYLAIGGALFIESEYWQAEQISNITKKPVYGFDSAVFFPGK